MMRWQALGAVLGCLGLLAQGCGDELLADAGVCSPEFFGEDGEIAFHAAVPVVDGRLGAACLGEADATLAEAWDVLAAVVPARHLTALAYLTGFVQDPGSVDVSLAFVSALDDAGREYQLAVNLDEVAADRDQFHLTVVHEYAHVLTSTGAEMDPAVGADECVGFFGGEGCHPPGSLLGDWVTAFWPAEQLRLFDPDDEPLVEDGEERCSRDDGPLGPYAATRPEEDFAEAFSAWVLRVPAVTAGQQERVDWLDRRPELAVFRERATTAGLGPLPNDFEVCG